MSLQTPNSGSVSQSWNLEYAALLESQALSLSRQARERARSEMEPFCRLMHPEMDLAEHHRFLVRHLERVERGENKRLMVFMPPGSAKSWYANVLYSAWYIGRHPTNMLITVSHGQQLADKWGRRTRNLVAGEEFQAIFGCGVASDNAAADRWATTRGGEYVAAGAGAGIAGNRADLGIIDDPVPGKEEADSETFREKQKEWYRNDFWPRLKPGAACIIIMTRWHEDDLAGWLLEEAKAGGEQWEVINLPALAESNDPLGRQPGDPLWPEWFTPAMFAEARRDERRWSALYQGRPSPETGAYFKREWLRYYDAAPPLATLQIYGASDYAVTADGGDFTVHAVFGVDPNDDLYLLELWREQAASDRWVEALLDLAARWKPLGWAEENGQIVKGVGPFIAKRMAERRVYFVRDQLTSATDKPTRAQSIRGRFAMGKVILPGADGHRATIETELMTFPAGRNDDIVDVFSLIGRKLDVLNAGRPLKPPPVEMPKHAQAALLPMLGEKRALKSWERRMNGSRI